MAGHHGTKNNRKRHYWCQRSIHWLPKSDGRRWVTREPAIVYFHKKYWFNIIAMIRDNGISYYCNMASPYYLDEEALKYIDYDLDVKIFTDGEKRLLDVEEYERHKRKNELF